MIKYLIVAAYAGITLSANAQSIGTGFYISKNDYLASMTETASWGWRLRSRGKSRS